MRLKLTILFVLCFGYCFSQSDSTTFTTYDSTISGGGINWNVKITRPLHYFDGTLAVDTGHRQIIMFMCGVGESGPGNFAGLAAIGPHYWLANGWTGRVPLGNGLHFPIIISVGPYSTFPASGALGDLFLILYNKFKGRPDGTHVTGLSQGSMTFGQLLTIEASPGENTFQRRIRSFVALQGSGTSCGQPDYTLGGYVRIGCDNPWITPFGTWASLGGKIFNLSGTGDGSGPGGFHMAFGMNSVVPHSGYTSYETLGPTGNPIGSAGSHCCWNTMYSPDSVTWGLGAGKRSYLTDAAFDTTYDDQGTYYNGSNVWQWMLRQGDTSLAGSPAASCAGTRDTLYGNDNWGNSGAYITPTVDTLFLNDTGGDAEKEGLWIQNWVGTPSCHKVIMADRSITRLVMTSFHAQIAFKSCEYVDVLGFGNKDTRGSSKIYINHGIGNTHEEDSITKGFGPGFHGISIGGRSKNITVDGVEFYNVNQGIEGKQDPLCDSNMVFINGRSNNFKMDSIVIQNNICVRTQAEGFYVGNTGPDSTPEWIWASDGCDSFLLKSYQARYVLCPAGTFPIQVPTHTGVAGLDTFWTEPMRLGYVKVYNNYTDSTGRGGIQVTTSDGTSLVEIYGNKVRHAGMIGHFDQGTGISIGTYVNGYIHDNDVQQTLSEGIVTFGSKARIENNRVDSSGFLNYYKSPYFEGTPPLPNWDFSSVVPDSCCNALTDHRPNIKVTSELKKYQRTDSIVSTIKNNLLGANKANVDSYYDGVPLKNKPGIWFQDYYQLFTINLNNPSIICGNRTLSGTLIPYMSNDTLLYSIQKSTLGAFGDTCYRYPQVNPAITLVGCDNPYYYINRTPGIRIYFKKY